MRKRIKGYFAVLFGAVPIVTIILAALPAQAAVSASPSPMDQIGIMVPFNATVAGPYTPYPPPPNAIPLDMTTTNGGCTWTAANSNANAVTAGQLDAVVYSFTTRRFGIEASAASAAASPLVFVYSGAPVGC